MSANLGNQGIPPSVSPVQPPPVVAPGKALLRVAQRLPDCHCDCGCHGAVRGGHRRVCDLPKSRAPYRTRSWSRPRPHIMGKFTPDVAPEQRAEFEKDLRPDARGTQDQGFYQYYDHPFAKLSYMQTMTADGKVTPEEIKLGWMSSTRKRQRQLQKNKVLIARSIIEIIFS